MSQTNAGIAPVIRQNLQPGTIDLTSRPIDFWSLLVSQGLVRPSMGAPVEWAVQYATTSGAELFVEDQAMGADSKRSLAKASLSPFYLRAPVSVTGHVRDQIRNGATIEDVAAREMDNATRDLFVLLESTLLGSTQDRGLASIVDSTGTYAGLNASTYASWASAETAVGGALTAAVMEDAHETLRAAPYNGMANAIACAPNQVTNYLRIMGPSASSTPTRLMLPQQGGVDIGVLKAQPSFNGTPLFSVNGVTNSEMYWLDFTDDGIIFELTRDLEVEKLAKVNDNDQWVMSIAGVLKVARRNRHLKLTGITA